MLQRHNRRDHHVRLAADTFSQLIKSEKGQLFILKNLDIFFAYRGECHDDVETSMWKRMATVLYASLSNETPEGHAYIFETSEGKVISFENKADFDAAVEADRKVREADTNAANPS